MYAKIFGGYIYLTEIFKRVSKFMYGKSPKILALPKYLIYMSLFPPFHEHKKLENASIHTRQKLEQSKHNNKIKKKKPTIIQIPISFILVPQELATEMINPSNSAFLVPVWLRREGSYKFWVRWKMDGKGVH